MILIFILEWGTFSSMNKVQKYMKIGIQEFAFSVEKNKNYVVPCGVACVKFFLSCFSNF